MKYINSTIHKLTTQGIEKIRQHLRQYGNITDIEKHEHYFALYLDELDYGVASLYTMIELFPDGQVVVTLLDGHTIYEDDLTTNHVLDIFNIINDKNGTYIKPTE